MGSAVQYLCVLNDGETFTNVEGCAIVAVPAGLSVEEIEELLDMENEKTVGEGGAQTVVYFDTDAEGKKVKVLHPFTAEVFWSTEVGT